MKLLLFCYEYPPLGGGTGNAVSFFSNELSRQGTDVTIVTSGFKGLLKEEKTESGVRILRLPVIRRYLYRCSVWEMVTYILSSCIASSRLRKKIQPDVCIAFLGIPSGPPAVLMRIFFNIPYLIFTRGQDVPGFLEEEIGFFHKILKPFTRYMWRKASSVIANSSGMAKMMQKTLPEKKFPVIPNGVDTDLFYPNKVLQKRNETIRFLFTGRVVAQKGLIYLIEACRLLRDSGGTNFTLDIIGDGPERVLLESKATEYNLHSIVTFKPWVDKQEMPAVYRQYDSFILPSLYEGMSNCLLEAMASGLAVIATAISGNEDLVEHEKNGLLVKVRDPEGIKSAMETLIKEQVSAREYGAAARACVKERNTWDILSKKLYDIMRKAVHNEI